MKQTKDNIFLGIAIGLGMPVAAYGILLTIYDMLDKYGLLDGTGFSENFRARTLALVAICSNILVIQYFMKRYASKSMRGVLLSTFILAVIWILYFKVISF